MKITSVSSFNNFGNHNINGHPFELISSKTAEIIYNTDFKYSGKDYGKDCFPTFVLSEKTGKPIEVFIKPLFLEDDYEEFGMFVSAKNKKPSLIGMRSYYLDDDKKLIIPGLIRSMGNGFKGRAFRLYQLTYERMQMLGYQNIEVISTVSAYPFHNLMGYSGSKENGLMTLSKRAHIDWSKIVKKQPILSSKTLNLIL